MSSSSASAVRPAGERRRELVGRHAELALLEQLLKAARNGESGTLTVHGDPGVGKTALLEELISSASGFRIARAAGVEGEVDLPYAGLHQLCRPMLDTIEALPPPQSGALQVAFGLSSGEASDRFLVGLATLSLLSETATKQPLLCVVDDAQWLDAETTQVLAFVARRLAADTVALAIASREHLEHLEGLPALHLEGLATADARTLLDSVVVGRLDGPVRERFLAETHGNPLALLELPHALTPAEAATGILDRPGASLSSRIEEGFQHRLESLPDDTRRLLVLAAAEPLGDPLLLHRAASDLGIAIEAADAAEQAELIEIRNRWTFRHPLIRSAAYRSATKQERRQAHGALAEATDARQDPNRKAWHRASASPAPDEDVALALERSAGRAQARGGFAAAAAFLERASALSPDFAKRAQRALKAAEAKQLAGTPQAATALLAAAIDGPLDELERALAQRLKGQIALDFRRGGEAMPLLLEAASRLREVEPIVARKTYLDALQAASFISVEMLRRAAEAARDMPALGNASSADDLMLTGLTIRHTEGYAASASLLKQALRAYRDEDASTVEDVRWPGTARRTAPDLFDDETWDDLATRSAQLARDRGALGVLPLALNNLAVLRSWEGELGAAATLVEESDAIADVTGAGRITFGRLMLASFRGDESVVSELTEANTTIAIAQGLGLLLVVGDHARALLHNGLGRYDVALRAAQNAGELDTQCQTVWSLPELVEAATRCGKHDVALGALERLTERTQAAGTEWALGIEARSRALLNEGLRADELYREAIDRLSRTRLRPELARAHLLYGEWLRRGARRLDAREQLRTAHEMFVGIGMEAFAGRARGELQASGEKVRRRTVETRDDLTAQERQIARLARDGLSNPEIAAQLFLSPRTVEWHLRNVFAKLSISSRRDLANALASFDSAEA